MQVDCISICKAVKQKRISKKRISYSCPCAPTETNQLGVLYVCVCRKLRNRILELKHISYDERKHANRTGRPAGTDALAHRGVDRPLTKAEPVVHGLAAAEITKNRMMSWI